MLKKQINKDELDRLGGRIKETFHLLVLESGLELQQKGYVYNTEITQDRKLVAKVQDLQVYDVQLDLDSPDSSVCTCPTEGTCKHMAAAFFYVFSVYGRPDAFVRAIKQEENATVARNSSTRNTSALHRKTVMLAAPDIVVEAPKESTSPEQWQSFMLKQWVAFTLKNQQHKLFLDDYYNAALRTITQPTQWWSRTPRLLFAVQAGLHLLTWLDDDFKQRQTLGYVIPGDRHREAADALQDKWKVSLRELDAEEAAAKWPEHLAAMADQVRLLLLDAREESPFSAIAIYRLLWSQLLQQASAPSMADEQERLEAVRSNLNLPEFTRNSALLAIVHFLLLQREDGRAWSVLVSGRQFRPEQLIAFFEEWQQQEDWLRIWQWIERLNPAFRTMNEKSFQLFSGFGHAAARALGCADEWLGKLSTLLPRSYYAYTEALMGLGRYRRWVNFHLAERIGLSSLYPIDMRVIETHDPSLLLPVYHQSIDDYIRQKNRTAYKEAIRLLKKLSALYKQLGRQDRFEAFIERLARHYARLRAFQEELKRGKLIR